MRKFLALGVVMASGLVAMEAQATLLSLGDCGGDAVSCEITDTPPTLIQENTPNDGKLQAWDEVQNFTLTTALRVDRVFDENASFVTPVGNDFLIAAGTVVSSHYIQWDPATGDTSRVTTTITLDSQAFAFITGDDNLRDSDFLGHPDVDYSDFGLRGLETGDTTNFNGGAVDINWRASSPGDWTRLITAFSPGGVTPVPLPAAGWLLFGGLGLLGVFGRRKPA